LGNIGLLIIVFSLVSIGAFSFSQNAIAPSHLEYVGVEEPNSVTTDKESYVSGDTIRISGFIRLQATYYSVDVTLLIQDSIGNIVFQDRITPNSDGTILTSIVASGPQWQDAGEYTIKANYLSQTAKTTFYFTGGTNTPQTPSPTPKAPLRQIAFGVLPEEIKCNQGLELIIKNNGSPACVKLETAVKLEARGWGVIPPPCCKDMPHEVSMESQDDCVIQSDLESLFPTLEQAGDMYRDDSYLYARHDGGMVFDGKFYKIHRKMYEKGIKIEISLIKFDSCDGALSYLHSEREADLREGTIEDFEHNVKDVTECFGERWPLKYVHAVMLKCVKDNVYFISSFAREAANDLPSVIRFAQYTADNFEYDFDSSSKTVPSTSQDCSGSARCFTGTVTQVIDGDTIKVDGQSIRFALASAPEITQVGGMEARSFIAELCPVGSTALVDEDDLQTQGSYGRILGVIHCNGVNLNKEILDEGLGYLSSGFCSTSEFATLPWAKKYGCN